MSADYPTDVAYFTRYSKHELARIELPAAGDARRMIKQLSGDWSAAELPHRCSQMFIEPVLYKHASKLPSVSLRHGVRLTGFTDHGDHVEVSATRVAEIRPSLFGHPGWSGATARAVSCVGNLGSATSAKPGRNATSWADACTCCIFARPHLYDVIPHGKAWMYWAFNRERRSFMCSIDGRGEFVFHTQIGRRGRRRGQRRARSRHVGTGHRRAVPGRDPGALGMDLGVCAGRRALSARARFIGGRCCAFVHAERRARLQHRHRRRGESGLEARGDGQWMGGAESYRQLRERAAARRATQHDLRARFRGGHRGCSGPGDRGRVPRRRLGAPARRNLPERGGARGIQHSWNNFWRAL